MAIYEVRALTISTENAWTELTENGRSQTAIKTVPAGVSRLSEIGVLWVPGGTAGVSNAAVRLEGQGINMAGATQEFGAQSFQPGGTNTQNAVWAMKYYSVDIPVNPGQDLRVMASVNGADVGASEMVVQLVYA